MPEGPEVRRYAELIRDELDYLHTFEVVAGRYAHSPLPLAPDGPVSVQWKGKFICLQVGDEHIWHTLGMSGHWSIYPEQHLRVIINDRLYYHDQRNYGTFKFGMTRVDTESKLLSLGIDLLNLNSSVETLVNMTVYYTAKHTICEVLMDQSIFAGVGNYVKAEALYLIGMSPFRMNLNESEARDLIHAVTDVMHQSYRGGYKRRVYRQSHSPLGNPTHITATPDKRNTHWVPQEQS